MNTQPIAVNGLTVAEANANALHAIGRLLKDKVAPAFAEPARQQLKVCEAAHWIRAGAPAKALEVLEEVIRSYKA